VLCSVANPIPFSMKKDDPLILEQSVKIEVLPTSDESNSRMCEICLSQFSTGNELYAHMILDHDGGTFEAEKYKNIGISEQWKRRLELEPNVEFEKRSLTIIQFENKSIENKKKPFQCGMCANNFATTEELKSHILFVHERKKTFQFHSRVNPGLNQTNKTYQCSDCDLCFITTSSLKKHFYSVHKIDEKDAIEVTNEEGDVDKRSDGGKNSSNDVSCLIESSKRVILKDLYCVGSPSGRALRHKCHVEGCDKDYAKTSHLKVHLGSHSTVLPFDCEFPRCGKRFHRNDLLIRHERIHTGEKKFICYVCKRAFSRRDSLSIHSKQHTRKQCRRPGPGAANLGPHPQNLPFNETTYVPLKDLVLICTDNKDSISIQSQLGQLPMLKPTEFISENKNVISLKNEKVEIISEKPNLTMDQNIAKDPLATGITPSTENKELIAIQSQPEQLPILPPSEFISENKNEQNLISVKNEKVEMISENPNLTKDQNITKDPLAMEAKANTDNVVHISIQSQPGQLPILPTELISDNKNEQNITSVKKEKVEMISENPNLTKDQNIKRDPFAMGTTESTDNKEAISIQSQPGQLTLLPTKFISENENEQKVKISKKPKLTKDQNITEDPLSNNVSDKIMGKSVIGEGIKCTFCPEVCNSIKDWMQHFRNTHPKPKAKSVRKYKEVENKFQCLTCETLCESLLDFSNHTCTQDHHQESKGKIMEDPLSDNVSDKIIDKSINNTGVKCTFCPKICDSEKDLIQHFTDTLGHPKPKSIRKFKKVENRFQCSTCEQLCESLRDFSDHICIQNQHQPKAKFPKLETTSVKEVKENNDEKSELPDIEKNSFQCTICEDTFTTTEELTSHIFIVHEGKTIIKCTISDMHFKRKDTLKEHIYSVHETATKSIHKCEICNKHFHSKYLLRHHMISVHDKKESFPCKICGSCFKYENKLEKHIERIHEDKKCEICSIQFASKKELKSHTEHIHEEKEKCTNCGKIYPTKE
jgi:hypothetical protein